MPLYPGRLPQSLAEAYRIQDCAIGAVCRPIGGWKVGRIGPSLAAQYGAERLAGPILEQSIQYASAGTVRSATVYPGGFGAAEAEFLFQLHSAPAPGTGPCCEDEVMDFVKSVHVGIEIASSPFSGINDLGPAVTVSDFGNNNGLIIGPEVQGWRRSRMHEWTVMTKVDGRVVGAGRAKDMPGGPIGSVRFILEHLALRGIPLEPGAWISSGAITGVHAVAAGERVTAVFTRELSVECLIEHAQPER